MKNLLIYRQLTEALKELENQFTAIHAFYNFGEQ